MNGIYEKWKREREREKRLMMENRNDGKGKKRKDQYLTVICSLRKSLSSSQFARLFCAASSFCSRSSIASARG